MRDVYSESACSDNDSVTTQGDTAVSNRSYNYKVRESIPEHTLYVTGILEIYMLTLLLRQTSLSNNTEIYQKQMGTERSTGWC